MDIFSKHICFKNEKSIAVPNAFQKSLEETQGRKPSKTWIYKSSGFYNRPMEPIKMNLSRLKLSFSRQ